MHVLGCAWVRCWHPSAWVPVVEDASRRASVEQSHAGQEHAGANFLLRFKYCYLSQHSKVQRNMFDSSIFDEPKDNSWRHRFFCFPNIALRSFAF